MKKNWYASKTIWLALITAGIGVVQAIQPVITDPVMAGKVVAVIGALNWVLRLITWEPIKMPEMDNLND